MSVLRGGASYASQGRISVAGHRAEPNEHGRSMCRERYSACSGYNCRWWAAVALGGPVSINQPALNTLPHPLPLARGIARLAGRSQLPPNAVCTHDLCLAANCRERTRTSSRSREASKYRFFPIHRGTNLSVLRVSVVFVRHEHCVRSVPRGKWARTIYFIRTDETSFFSSCHHDRISIRFVRCFVKHAHNKHDRCADELSRNSSTPLSNLSLEIRLSIYIILLTFS